VIREKRKLLEEVCQARNIPLDVPELASQLDLYRSVGLLFLFLNPAGA
jgi:hypothetical protein